ncbi:hypothetical protein ACFLZY_01475 [Patescibacteria group bacterium]
MSKLQIIKDPNNEIVMPIGNLESGEMVGLAPEDRIGNMLIMGKTGQGKSVEVGVILLSNILQGRGGLFIDPHGDIVDNVLKHMPENIISKTAVFDLGEGSLEENIKRFEDEIHLEEMKKDDKKFLLIRLHTFDLKTDVPLEFGQHLLKQFYEIVGNQNRSVIIDEAQNFLTKATIENVLDTKSNNSFCVLVGQSTKIYTKEILDKMLQSTDHVISYKADEVTAETLINGLSLDAELGDITDLEQYTFIGRFTVNGELTENIIAKGVFPIPYPEVK